MQRPGEASANRALVGSSHQRRELFVYLIFVEIDFQYHFFNKIKYLA
jgi:hypothetical protein